MFNWKSNQESDKNNNKNDDNDSNDQPQNHNEEYSRGAQQSYILKQLKDIEYYQVA